MIQNNSNKIVERSLISAIRRAKKGSMYNFYRNPFIKYDKPLTGLYDKIFFGRKEELAKISKFIGIQLMESKEDIVIVGAKGSGTRTLVNFIGNYFSRHIINKKEVHPLIEILKDNLVDVDNREVCYFGPYQREMLLEKMERYSILNRTTLITSFFCDEHIFPLQQKNKYDESTIQTYAQMLNIDCRVMDEIVFMSSWHSSAFLLFLLMEPQLARSYEKIEIIEPMKKNEIINILKRRIDYFGKGEAESIAPFTMDTLEKIAEYSGGFPRYALEFSYRIIKKASAEGKDKITINFLDEFLKDSTNESEYNFKLFPYKDAVNAFENGINKEKSRGKTKKNIFLTMIGLGGKDIIFADVAKRLELSRAAMNKAVNKIIELQEGYNIEILRKSVSKHKDERTTPYDMNPLFWSIFEYLHVNPAVSDLWNNHRKAEWLNTKY